MSLLSYVPTFWDKLILIVLLVIVAVTWWFGHGDDE